MTKETFLNLLLEVEAAGYADELAWAREIQPCDNSIDFRDETIWVILNSGMKEQIARIIQHRVYNAMAEAKSLDKAFKHTGKVAAIRYVWDNCSSLFEQWLFTENKIEFLLKIPYIGKITVWHLAKNLGLDCAKPDRHLIRVASQYDTTPDELCARLARQTGERIALVDTVIWRACNLGIL